MTPSKTFPKNTNALTTLLYGAGIKAFWHVIDVFKLCARKGITLKQERFQFCHHEAKFVGFHLDWVIYRTADSLAVIKNFSMPEQPSITVVRSWYAFVNQLAPFLATVPIMELFHDLKKIYLDEHLQQKFN